MKGTKEFYELMTQFEKDIKEIMYGHKIERAGRGAPSSVFYDDGLVNQLFRAYMMGYANGKCVQRQI